jgi:hypothetical protein
MKIIDLLIEKIESSFNNIKTGISTIVIAYHVSLKKNLIISKNSIFFCDNPKDWASPWLKNPPTIYKIKIKLNNPYVILNSSKDFETEILPLSNEFIKNGYDSIIWTPSRKIKNTSMPRQGVLLTNAIKKVTILGKLSKK